MIRKHITDITPDDIRTLCGERLLEDEQMDFKESIPHKDGEGKDPWRDQQVIRDHGRDQLLATLVAFANSYGGDLIIGIRERHGTQPGQAETVAPIPACADAANRLGQMARACVDPPLPNAHIQAVPFSDDGSGVVILRTSPSRMAPHRLVSGHAAMKECFHRVRHETVAMTMRQIQDLTFNVSRGLELVSQRFANSKTSTREWLRQFSKADKTSRLCIRVSVTPAGSEIYLDRVHNVDQVRPSQRNVRARVRPEGPDFQLTMPFNLYHWRPALRSSESEDERPDRHARVLVQCDGTISYTFVRDVPADERGGDIVDQGRRPLLYPGWLFAIVVNAVESAVNFRRFAGASAVEYAVEVEVATSHPLPVLRFADAGWYDTAGTLSAGERLFPRYVVGSEETLSETYNLFFRDFWNSIGVETGEEIIVLTE